MSNQQAQQQEQRGRVFFFLQIQCLRGADRETHTRTYSTHGTLIADNGAAAALGHIAPSFLFAQRRAGSFRCCTALLPFCLSFTLACCLSTVSVLTRSFSSSFSFFHHHTQKLNGNSDCRIVDRPAGLRCPTILQRLIWFYWSSHFHIGRSELGNVADTDALGLVSHGQHPTPTPHAQLTGPSSVTWKRAKQCFPLSRRAIPSRRHLEHLDLLVYTPATSPSKTSRPLRQLAATV